MYLWIAIDVNEQIRELRENAENYIKKSRINIPNINLAFSHFIENFFSDFK